MPSTLISPAHTKTFSQGLFYSGSPLLSLCIPRTLKSRVGIQALSIPFVCLSVTQKSFSLRPRENRGLSFWCCSAPLDCSACVFPRILLLRVSFLQRSFLLFFLFHFDCARRAYFHAAAAVHAGVFIYFRLIVLDCYCSRGAFFCAGAASNAGIFIDFCCHLLTSAVIICFCACAFKAFFMLSWTASLMMYPDL